MALLALLICLVPGASAAGSAYLGGPDTVRAGDTITLVFYAGGGIYGGSGSVSYDSSQLTLQGYTPAIGGSWGVEFAGNTFVFYDNSMASPITGSAAIFSATFSVNSSLQPGTEIAVTAASVVLSNGEMDIGAGSPAYRRTIAPPLSDNCNLSSLTVSNATISPAFSPAVTSYSASVPFTTAALQLSATAEHDAAQVSMSNPPLTPGETSTVHVTVTAENGTTKTYSIRVSRAQDPNYVPSDDAELRTLAVEGYSLSPAFDPGVLQYYIWLPYEAEAVTLTAEKSHGKAKLNVPACPELIPGMAVDIPITVTAENGAQQVYTLCVFRAPAHQDTEDFLQGARPVVETQPEMEPTEPETTAQPEELPVGVDVSILWAFIAVGVASAAAGVGVMALITHLIRKKKDKDLYNL